MQFDIKNLFSGTRDIDVMVEPMEFPFLIDHVFDWRPERRGAYRPEALSSVLQHIVRLFVERSKSKPQELHDRLMRSLRSPGWPNGFLGTDNLPIEEIAGGRSWTSIVIGLTGAKLELKRYGDCLGVRTSGRDDKPHEETETLLGELATSKGPSIVRPFIHRYGFVCSVELEHRRDVYVLDMVRELEAMDRYLPDIRWTGKRERIAADLGGDFTTHRQGLVVGSYGDAEIRLRVVYENEVNDEDWRIGKVRSTTGTELAFGVGTGTRPRLEYFLRTVDGNNSYNDAVANIDYQSEQGLLHDLARMLYAGLYQRMHQRMVENGNLHFVRFRREPEKTTAAV